jgi:hypothetical protein
MSCHITARRHFTSNLVQDTDCLEGFSRDFSHFLGAISDAVASNRPLRLLLKSFPIHLLQSVKLRYLTQLAVILIGFTGPLASQ